MKKVFIWGGVVLVLFGAFLVIALSNMYDADHSVANVDPITGELLEQDNEQVNPADPECTGEKNEYYDIGYGVEHVYQGSITKDMSVKMVLSCDHERLTISGAVNQVIEGKEIKESDIGEIADTSSGSVVVYLEEDTNKDGYNDLETVVANGSQVDTYAVFLFDPIKKQFVFSETYEVSIE